MARKINIATRKSPLALWQAEHVKSLLEQYHPGIEVELIGMTTRGDKILDAPLAKVGGKGLFVKELEHALLEQEADIAVHSMKDVPMDFPEHLGLAVIGEREEPKDAFVSNQYKSLDELPQGAVVGTSSLRRQCQISQHRPDLVIKSLRGNVNTRLAKLDAGEFDAIILAGAGLLRLGMEDRIASLLSTEQSLPAGGQGALGIECRMSDVELIELIKPLHHDDSACCVLAERAVNKRLEGGCQVPIACFAELTGDKQIFLRALVGSPDGKRILRSEVTGDMSIAEELGIGVAEDLLAQGAGEILKAVYGS